MQDSTSNLASLFQRLHNSTRSAAPIDLAAKLPLVGEVLADSYNVNEFLGSGGMGLVFVGEKLNAKGAVSIKTPRLDCTLAMVQRFVREASITLPPSPNIVQTVDHFLERGRLYHVQELIPGRTLQELLFARIEGQDAKHQSEQPLFDIHQAPKVIVKAIADVARAVSLLHHENIVHRDLKPGNIIWHEKGRAVVIDFGLASYINV